MFRVKSFKAIPLWGINQHILKVSTLGLSFALVEACGLGKPPGRSGISAPSLKRIKVPTSMEPTGITGYEITHWRNGTRRFGGTVMGDCTVGKNANCSFRELKFSSKHPCQVAQNCQ